MELEAGELESHRTGLTGHCYRMLGSAADAEDAAQEAIIRAWRSRDRFERRASLKTWLYRIATNVCLDNLRSGARRMRPIEEGEAGTIDSPLETLDRAYWLEPVADARVLPSDATPHELAVLRESIRLAFVAALQHLPARQRAALLLTEVLGWSAAEVAESLETTVQAVNSALQRARATLGEKASLAPAASLSAEDLSTLERYVDAFHRYDVDGLAMLLREDATMSMPPYRLWLRGPASVRGWLTGPGHQCRGSRLVPVQASGSPSFAQYRRSPDGNGYYGWGLIVLKVEGGRITEWNSFLDTETLFPMFDLPLRMAD